MGLIVALLLAACGGSSSAPPEVASLEQGAKSDSKTDAARPSFERVVLDMAACMRDEGAEVADPTFDAQGRLVFTDQAAFNTPEFRAAFQACTPILLEAVPDVGGLDPEFLARVQDGINAYAGCMRNNGVEDFPDPEFVGGVPRLDILNELPTDDPDFQAADRSCRDHLNVLQEAAGG